MSRNKAYESAPSPEDHSLKYEGGEEAKNSWIEATYPRTEKASFGRSRKTITYDADISTQCNAEVGLFHFEIALLEDYDFRLLHSDRPSKHYFLNLIVILRVFKLFVYFQKS
jgi:hypothetical protein